MSDIEKIKDRLSIEEVVGSYIKLEKAGKNLKARCPFHNEKTPSFIISPERGNYYCFGCGKNGDIFSFVQEYEGVEFTEALKILAERAGVEVNFDSKKENLKKKEYLKILEKATSFFETNLKTEQAILNYLKERGLEEKDIKKWRIGFSKNEWNSLGNYFQKLEVKKEVLDKIGLIKKGEKGDYYDRFRSRIMFPISDINGNIIGFTGRIFGTDDQKQAKYINSPDTELFNKSKILYGYHLAKGAIRKNNFSILVEGQFDVIAAHKMGYLNSVATSGTALTDDQLTLLNRLSSRLVLALDADSAGFRASERAWQMALSKGMDVKIANLPEGKDPGDLLLEDSNKWKEAIKKSKHIIDFIADKIYENNLSGRELALEIHESLVPYISKIESAVEKAHFVEKISNKFSIEKEALWMEIKTGTLNSNDLGQEKKDIERKNIIFSVEKQLLGIILWKKDEDLKEKMTNIIGTEKFSFLEKEYSQEVDALIFMSEDLYGKDSTILENVKKELLLRLEKNKLDTKRAEIRKQILKTEENNDLLKELNEISKKIENLGK
jgi:DNA primase